MQTGSVPFFTFPSTPPSYIPANSYPYTFAPLPAPPFSISPIQPGAAAATVAVPSYTGIAVPQVTAVEPIVTLNSAPAIAAGVVHPAQAPTYPVAAAIQSLNESGEAQIQNVTLASHANPGAATAVAVGINGATVNVIQQPVIHPAPAHEVPNSSGGVMMPTVSAAPTAIHAPGHDLAVIHTLGPTHQHFQTNSSLHAAARPTLQRVAHAPAALIQTAIQANDDSSSLAHHHAPQVHLVRSSLANIDTQGAAVVGPSSVSNARESSDRRRNGGSIFVNSHQSSSSEYVSPPTSFSSTPTHSPDAQFSITARVARLPSPSSGDESDSSSTSSVGENFTSMFYPVPSYSPLTSDSDSLESPDLSESPNPFSGRESTDILSDRSNNMSEQSDSEGDSASDSSALHTLANAAVILADSPGDELDGSTSSQSGSSHSNESDPLRLPVLINISGSEISDRSRVDTPASVIDLTTSPTTSTPSSLSESQSPSNTTSSTVNRNLQSSLDSAAAANRESHHLSHHTIATPLLLPVIQHQATNVIAANLAVRAQQTNGPSFNAPTNAPQVQLADHTHGIQVTCLQQHTCRPTCTCTCTCKCTYTYV